MKRVIRVVLFALLAVVLTGVFYIAVVMGQPPEDVTGEAHQPRTMQALPEPLEETVAIAREDGIAGLAEAFPAPVMYAAGRGLTFMSGECRDVPFEQGVARVVTLTYRTENFDVVTVQSIYPARALSLLGKDGRTFDRAAADTLAGMKYVGMRDAATLRMHAQGEEALYVFTVPLAERAVVDQWTNALQLLRPAE